MTDATRAREERYVLAIDLGTGGPKVGLVSLVGEVAWSEHTPVVTRYIDGGGAVQDASHWWEIIVASAQRGLASGVVSPDRVVAVSVTGQWASTVPVAADGTPVGDCILWMDTRGGPHSRKMAGGPVAGYAPLPLTQWLRRTGGAPSMVGADPIGHYLYLREDEPATYREARWLLEPVDYLTMRFTGAAQASLASMTCSWLTDNRRPEVPSYDAELVARVGVDRAKLPPLTPTGSVVGTVRDDVADLVGLPHGVVAVAGTTDAHSSTVGSGAVLDYEAHLSISTSSWISCSVPAKKTDALHSLAAVPGVGTGSYLLINSHETSGLCLQWLRDNVLDPDDGLKSGADAGGDAREPIPFTALDDLAARSAPGSGGIIFTPWLAGERTPVEDRNARAGWHNMSLTSTRADLVRSVLEGVAYNDRWLLDAVEHYAKRPLRPIRMIGGGAASPLWCRIHADVLDREILQVADPLNTALRGAALFAGMALDAVRLDELASLVKVKERFVPDPTNRDVYDSLYAEFPKLYKLQKSMFKRLNRSRRA